MKAKPNQADNRSVLVPVSWLTRLMELSEKTKVSYYAMPYGGKLVDDQLQHLKGYIKSAEILVSGTDLLTEHPDTNKRSSKAQQ